MRTRTFHTQLGWLLILAVATTPVTARGESEPAELSLSQLLEEVQRVNPQLASARKRWEAVRAKIPQARGLPAPRIGVEWEEIPRGSFKVNQATLMYQLIQSLPFPGKLSARHRVAVAEAQVAAAVYKQAVWDVTSMMKAAYYDLYLIGRELELQQTQRLWLQQAAATAQARYATGQAPQAELLRAQMKAAEAANALTVLAHRRQAATAHINHLLNRPGHTLAGQPPPLALQPVPASPEELLAMAQEQQPELLMFQFSAERAEAAWRLAKRELLPDLETMIELRDPAMGPFGPWDLTLALVLPFWFWTKQQYGVKAALYDKESAQAAYQAMRNEVERRIHEHWHEASAAYATAQLCQAQLIPLGEQAVASALAAYQGGRGSFMALLEALEALTAQQRTYQEHLVMVEQHLVMLEQAVGVPLRAAHEATMAGGAS